MGRRLTVGRHQFSIQRYTKGVPFLPNILYKMVRGWTSGGAPPEKTFLSSLGQHTTTDLRR